MKKLTAILIAGSLTAVAFGQSPLITAIPSRTSTSLDGSWQYIVDPYETGFYNYRYEERKENDKEAYWSTDVPANKSERKEFGYADNYTLRVPGDWNSQDPKFLYYEGTVWYKRSFDFTRRMAGNRVFLYFGAVNYQADVYLNGRKLGSHKGGFTPFNFEIPDTLIKAQGNYLVVKVDNKRKKDEIPTLNTDWWNYGGITREVKLVEVPKTFIREFSIALKKGAPEAKEQTLEGWVKLNAPATTPVTVDIPELGLKKQFTGAGDSVKFTLTSSKIQLWSTESPKRYEVNVSTASDRVSDKIGFRTVEVRGSQIILNGKPVFLRGICIHEEIAKEGRRAHDRKDAELLLGQAKALNANMVRLAHYPHSENMTRTADSLGILVWSEIPVYWTIEFTNPAVLQKAKQQLNEMITRDRNRASVIIWSVGNETPVNPARTTFMSTLALAAKALDDTRLISAALEVHTVNGVSVIDDPLGAYTDIVSVNEYIGWYNNGIPEEMKWDVKYNKPLFISETGAEALGGFHADEQTMWSEELQESFYKKQIAMMKKMPANFTGLSPWLLADFRSPRRANPKYQEGWNNKGLFDHQGNKKKAFYILKAYYDEKAKEN